MWRPAACRRSNVSISQRPFALLTPTQRRCDFDTKQDGLERCARYAAKSPSHRARTTPSPSFNASGLLIITGIWVGAGFALEQTQLWREEKKVWVSMMLGLDFPGSIFLARWPPLEYGTCSQAYNKDFYQRALLRRDWYLHREEETIAMSRSSLE